jgi:ribosomal protein S27AE
VCDPWIGPRRVSKTVEVEDGNGCSPASQTSSPMNEWNIPTRPRWCPRCGARARIIVNPYYGVGLAVHQHLSSCRRCGSVEFLPATRHDGDENHPIEPPRAPSHWRRAQGDVGARAQRVGRWARTNRVALSLLLVLVMLSIAMLAVVLLR